MTLSSIPLPPELPDDGARVPIIIVLVVAVVLVAIFDHIAERNRKQ